MAEADVQEEEQRCFSASLLEWQQDCSIKKEMKVAQTSVCH